MQVTTSANSTNSAPQVGPIRSSLANSLRAAGDGYAKAADLVGVSSDKTWIHPTEAVYDVGQKLDNATKKNGFFNMIARGLKTGGGFAMAYFGMLTGGILRSPGDLVKDLSYGAADVIDGKKTRTGDFGFGLPGAAGTTGAVQGAAETAVTTQIV